MASKYNNLTRMYRVNIQRKNSVSRKQARRGEPSLATPPATKLTGPATTLPAETALGTTPL